MELSGRWLHVEARGSGASSEQVTGMMDKRTWRDGPEQMCGDMACTLGELTGWWGKHIIQQILRTQ